MQIAYRARDLAEAHIISGMLQAQGIEAYVGGHYLQGAMGEIGAAGFTNVHVEDEDYPRARDLVADYESSVPQGDATTADANGDIEDRANRYATWFLLAMAVLLAILFGAL